MNFFIKMDRLLLLVLPFAIVLPVGKSLGGVTFSVVEVTLLGIIAATFFIYFGKGELYRMLSIPRKSIPVFVFVLICMLSFLAAADRSSGFMAVVRYLEAAVLLVMVLKAIEFSDTSLDDLFRVLKYAGVLAAGLSVAQFYLGIGTMGEMSKYHDVTRSGGLYHGGAFGVLPATGMVLAAISAMRKNNRLALRLYDTGLVLFCLIGLFLTLARTWLLAPFVGLAVYLLLYSFRRFIVYATLLPLVLVIILFAIIRTGFVAQLYGDEAVHVFVRLAEISMLASSDLEKTSVGSRFDKWSTTLDIAKKNPLLGVGPENIDLNMRGTKDELGQKRPDNQWLQILAENGIVAFMVLLFMVLWMTVRGYRTSRLPGKAGEHGRMFMALYFTWLAGSVFWAIMSGFVVLMFAFLMAVGIKLTTVALDGNYAAEEGRAEAV